MSSVVDLTYRDQLPPIVAAELDALIPRIIAATLARTTLKQLVDYVPWTDVPYAASNFLQNAGTWTVPQAKVVLHKYMVLDKTMFYQFSAFQTSVAGMNSARINMPAGYKARNHTAHVGQLIWSNSLGVATKDTATSDNPKAATGDVVVGVGGTYLQLQRNDPTTTVGAGFADGASSYNFAFSAVVQLV